MDYDKYSDEELIDYLRDGDAKIVDFLVNKYKNLVRMEAGNMFIIGGEKEDLIQEGMIGLFKAVRDFDPGRDSSFLTFARLCVSRQMYTAIQAAGRQKHTPLNTYISIYEDDFQKIGGIDPEEAFLDKERVAMLEETFEKQLSSFEKQVLDLKITGLDYQEIAAILGKDSKSTDNALSRIKSKLKKILYT